MVETPDKPFERFIRGIWNLPLLWSIPNPYMAASMPHDAAGKATARFDACCGPDCHNVKSGRSRRKVENDAAMHCTAYCREDPDTCIDRANDVCQPCQNSNSSGAFSTDFPFTFPCESGEGSRSAIRTNAV